MKRFVVWFLCVMLLCGVLCTAPVVAESDGLHGAFMKTAFMVARYKAFFAQGEVPISFIIQYLEHICPEMRTYDVIREPYQNIVHRFYGIPVEEFDALVQRYFEWDDRIRTELQQYYRSDVDMYYIPNTVVDAVHDFSWDDYVGYKPLGDGVYELYAYSTSRIALSDVSGLKEGVDYVSSVEHRKRFHSTLQIVFIKAEVYRYPITHIVGITVRLKDGVPQLVSTVVCDASRLSAEGVIRPPSHALPACAVNVFLPADVTCDGTESLPNGTCLLGEKLTDGDTYQTATGLFSGKVSDFTVYDLTAVDEHGEPLSSTASLHLRFSDYGSSGTVYRLTADGRAIYAGKADTVDGSRLGVFVVAASALPTTASPTTTASTVSPTTSSGTTVTEPTETVTLVTTTATSALTTATVPAQNDGQEKAIAVPIVVGVCAVAVAVLAVAVCLLLKKKRG